MRRRRVHRHRHLHRRHRLRRLLLLPHRLQRWRRLRAAARMPRLLRHRRQLPQQPAGVQHLHRRLSAWRDLLASSRSRSSQHSRLREGRAPWPSCAKAAPLGALARRPRSPARRRRRSLRARTRTRRATSRGPAAEVGPRPESVARRLRSRARSARPAAAAPGWGAWGGQVDRQVRDAVERTPTGGRHAARRPADARPTGMALGRPTGGQRGGQTGGQTGGRRAVLLCDVRCRDTHS